MCVRLTEDRWWRRWVFQLLRFHCRKKDKSSIGWMDRESINLWQRQEQVQSEPSQSRWIHELSGFCTRSVWTNNRIDSTQIWQANKPIWYPSLWPQVIKKAKESWSQPSLFNHECIWAWWLRRTRSKEEFSIRVTTAYRKKAWWERGLAFNTCASDRWKEVIDRVCFQDIESRGPDWRNQRTELQGRNLLVGFLPRGWPIKTIERSESDSIERWWICGNKRRKIWLDIQHSHRDTTVTQ